MKRTLILGFLLISVCLTAAVYAQNPINQKVPEGMEAIRIGGSGWLIVPKGAKTRKVGAQIIVEGVKEYMSRRFEENEQRFEKNEQRLENNEKRFAAMEKTIKDLTQQVELLKKSFEQNDQEQQIK